MIDDPDGSAKLLCVFDGVIHGYEGSTAQTYADKYGYKFQSLGKYNPTITSTSTAATTTESATTTATTTASVQPEVTFGDPTGDGKIDAKDSSLVLVEYAKLSTGGESTLSKAEQDAADVNGDGKADAKDASAILSYYAYVSTGGTDTIQKFLKTE